MKYLFFDTETTAANPHVANAHNALADVKATAKCFFELKKKGVIEH